MKGIDSVSKSDTAISVWDFLGFFVSSGNLCAGKINLKSNWCCGLRVNWWTLRWNLTLDYVTPSSFQTIFFLRGRNFWGSISGFLPFLPGGESWGFCCCCCFWCLVGPNPSAGAIRLSVLFSSISVHPFSLNTYCFLLKYVS